MRLEALLSVDQVAAQHRELQDLYDNPKAVDRGVVDEGIQALEHSPGWTPIAVSGRGRDLLCLDMRPDTGGNTGQVIRMAVDFPDRRLVARSFDDLLSLYFQQLHAGELAP